MTKYTGFNTIEPLNMPYKIKVKGILMGTSDVIIIETHGALYGLNPLINTKYIDEYNLYKIETKHDIDEILKLGTSFYPLDEILELERYSFIERNGINIPTLNSNIFTIIYDFMTNNAVLVLKSHFFFNFVKENKLEANNIKDYLYSLLSDLQLSNKPKAFQDDFSR